MATTTNYGWDTPDDTDLVKDGASAIRTLGSSVDTTVKNLNPETTAGDISYRSSTTNVNTRLALGTAGQVLQVNSGATAPEWATISSGGMTLISETVASANSSITFSGISGSYKQLMLVWHGVRHSTTGSSFGLRLNNASTGIYLIQGLQYTGGVFNVAGSSPTTLEGTSSSTAGYAFGTSTSNAALVTDSMGWVVIDNYASATKTKSWNATFAYYDAAADGYRGINAVGIFNSTSAVTSLNIVRLSGAATLSNSGSSTIRLYGVS